MPVDARFDADFENVYFPSYFKKLPVLGPGPENMQNRQFFAYTSQTS